MKAQLSHFVKDGIPRSFRFQIWVLWDLASTDVLHQPCSSSLDFRISRGSGWLDLVVSEEHTVAQKTVSMFPDLNIIAL